MGGSSIGFGDFVKGGGYLGLVACFFLQSRLTRCRSYLISYRTNHVPLKRV